MTATAYDTMVDIVAPCWTPAPRVSAMALQWTNAVDCAPPATVDGDAPLLETWLAALSAGAMQRFGTEACAAAQRDVSTAPRYTTRMCHVSSGRAPPMAPIYSVACRSVWRSHREAIDALQRARTFAGEHDATASELLAEAAYWAVAAASKLSDEV